MNARVLKKRKNHTPFFSFRGTKAMKLALALTVLAACGFSGSEISRYLLSDPKYTVTDIVVRGNEKLSEEEVIRLSMLVKGENIFRARIYRAKNRLCKLSLVKHASVSRQMPDTILIEVVERSPKARLAGPKNVLADYSGVILPIPCCSDPEQLPLIVGLNTARLSVGEKCSQPGLTRAMQVLRLWQASPLSGVAEVDGIDSSRPDDIRLYLRESAYTGDGCEVRVGGDDFPHRLAKLHTILKSVVEKHAKKIRSVDLTLENVPVRF